MTVKELYRYERPDGGIDVSPVQPTGVDYTIQYRLIANEGMILSNGVDMVPCIDVDTPEGWVEIPYEEEE